MSNRQALRSSRLLLLLGIALFLTSCGSGARPIGSQPFAPASARPSSVQLIVQNQNFSEATLYTIRRGRRSRLGNVGGKQEHEFTIDWDIPEPMRIEIRLLAGPRCLTQEMMIDPGDVLELQIRPVLTETMGCR